LPIADQNMRESSRSGCPINLTLETLGDRCSLIVIRHVMFGNRRHYGQLLKHSEERIASNILANRLRRLVSAGLLSRTADISHAQKTVYSLTHASIELVPLFAQMGAWGGATSCSSFQTTINKGANIGGGKAKIMEGVHGVIAR
jgi:DNA-binding HxlR family transcriptional regulator